MRILFITATRLGDAVLSTGLLEHLLTRYPAARFTVACGPVAAGVFARMPRLDRVIVVEKRAWDLHWLTLWGRVVRTAWDLVVDLRGSALSLALIARRRAIMQGGRRAIMQGGRRPGHRLTHLAGTLGLAQAPLPVAWMGMADRALAASLLPDGLPIIGLGPTANWDGKIWPPARFALLAERLRGRLPGARVAVFAGPGDAERGMAAPVLASVPGAIDLVGRLDIAEAAACLARCCLFVGNDSGLMHLAAASGTPTLGLFGPTPASAYAPAGRMTAVVEAEGVLGAASMGALPVQAAEAGALGLLVRAGLLPDAP